MASKRKTATPGGELKRIDGIHKRLNQALGKVADKDLEKLIRALLHELAEAHLLLYGGSAGDEVVRWIPE